MMYQPARAAVTKYTLGVLNNRNHYFFAVLEDETSTIKVMAESISGRALSWLPSLCVLLG